jgi:hypothetical protein
MWILQPDINISLNRGGSWRTPPDQATGNSYFVGTDLNDYERANLTGAANYRDSVLVNDWAAGAYVIGNVVRYGTSIFQCVADTSNEPTKNLTTPWLWIAYSNKFNSINGVLESRTYGYSAVNGEFQDWSINLRTSATTAQYSNADGVSQTDAKSSRITQIAIMNIYQIDVVTVELKKSDNTTVLYNESFSVGTYYLTGEVGATAYFDTPKDSTTNSEIGNSLIVDIPSVGNGYLTITFSASGTNKMRGVGGVFTGTTLMLATANWGSSFDATQFSKIEANQFGEYSFVERGYKNNFTYNLAIDTDTINGVRQILLRNRAYPCVYIGDATKQTTINYGVFGSIVPSLQYGTTIANLEIKGV